MSDFLWLIPLCPALGFLVNGLIGRKLSKRAVSAVACGVVLLSFLLSVAAVAQLAAMPAGERVMENRALTWIPRVDSGGGPPGLALDWLYVLDPLSAVMILVVTGVGFLIHVYSIGYMWEEQGYWRYFTYLNLFMAMMLTLVLGGSFAVMFVGWEGVGLCSYLLIGYYHTRTDCADAGRKAFITNRIGDLAFVAGTLTLFALFGTLEFRPILAAVASGEGPYWVLAAVGLALFVGACGKSAQIPLYVWLPDAMAGPTPVSALIHAATMVTAGVYMVCRLAPLYLAAPVALTVVAIVGAATALFAATIGIAQNDIKKVLAYSTVSQLGYMFVAAGVGAFGAAVFHLTTHAFFKALLFLGSGAVIHALHHEQDMMKMGGLKAKLPVTHAVFLCGWAAIAGVPLTSGFFSKDEILWKSFLWSPLLWASAAATAVITAFYMTRLMGLTFWGRSRMDHHAEAHVHEVPGVMKWPLIILAALALLGGFLSVPPALGGDLMPFTLEGWLHPVFTPATYAASGHHGAHGGDAGHAGEEHGGHHGAAAEYGLMLLASTLAVLTMWLGWRLYDRHPEKAAAWKERFAGIHGVLKNKYWVDELYDAVVIRSFYSLCRAAHVLDVRVVDGVVHLVRNVTVGTSYLSVFWDTWVVDGLVNLTGRTVRAGSGVLRRLQTGLAQSYASAMVLGLFLLICVYMYMS
ncbi:MAG TPA: NADH-quinone oxidoreductase subunit L [Candidatus Polarisedimenticolia bacterium]|nr:NADH-quinone oxidoreductase subunit L [Candidatus Polarisedimenticolia bacterium]